MTGASTREERVIISGASGLIGSALVESLRHDGISAIRLVRRAAAGQDEIEWNPYDSDLDPEALAGAKAVVNLNGASIGRLPWTRSYRETLRDSRLLPTQRLASALRRLGADASLFVSASAVGVYGHRPGEQLTESSDLADNTFLARLSIAWEEEALRVGPEAKVALLRTAPLLHPESVLKPLIALTRVGVSGPLGTGEQIWPWISLEDEVRAIRHIIDRGITGPVNLSGPAPASANEIGRELSRRMRRPYLLPAPRWALRLGLGRNAADSLLLADARVSPEVLADSGFAFSHTTAQTAIADALRRG